MAPKRRQPRAMSKRLRRLLSGLSLLVLAVLVWLDHNVVTPTRTESLPLQQQGSDQDFARYDGKTFTVVRIVDGDTLHLNVPDANRPTTTVRLLGIDAPEMHDNQRGQMFYAREATEFVPQFTYDRAVTVYLDRTTARTRGTYGRLLAYLVLPDGQVLNEALLLEGCAYADLRFRHGSFQRYQQLEATARSLQKGMWSDVTREQLPDWLQRMQPSLLAR